MHIRFDACWLQKAGNAAEEYEDAFAPTTPIPLDEQCAEFHCAVADGATETSFSGLWAQLLVEAFVDQRLMRIKPEAVAALAALWREQIDARTSERPLPWYALEKLERGAFSSLIGLSLHADGHWRAMCVGDSCLFHVRPRQPIRAFPYHLPEQFDNHPLLISTAASVKGKIARGRWKDGDYFLLMSDALAHFFLSQRAFRPNFLAPDFDQAAFEQMIAGARGDHLCRNDDVTLLRISPDGLA